MQIAALPKITASHLVKSIDLNHHGTLFAGRMAEWLVETGFMTARAALDVHPSHIVCVRLHGMDFRHSVAGGETVVLKGKAAHVGRSSITIHVTAHALRVGQEITIDTEGFATFVHIVDGRAVPHGLEVQTPTDPKSWTLWERVVRAREQQRKESG